MKTLWTTYLSLHVNVCTYVYILYIIALISSFLAPALASWDPVSEIQELSSHIKISNPALSFQKTLTICKSDVKLYQSLNRATCISCWDPGYSFPST